MRGLAVLAAAVLLAPAAHAQQARVLTIPGEGGLQAPMRSFVDLRFEQVVRQTEDLSCGAAALATLLKSYLGYEVSEKSVIAGMLETAPPEDRAKIAEAGFSLLELKRYAESLGLVAGGFKAPAAEDLRHLRAPAIALINSRGYNHFVVIRRVDGDEVAIADPAYGNRVESLNRFAKSWNHVILVAVSPDRPGDPNFMVARNGASDPLAAQLALSRVVSAPLARLPGEY